MKPVDRNIQAAEYERQGRVQEAIELYEANVRAGFPGSRPYDRLAAIYKRLGRTSDVVRVLERAVAVFAKLDAGGSPRSDVAPKLERYRAALARALTS